MAALAGLQPNQPSGPVPQPAYGVGGPYASTAPPSSTTTPRGTQRYDPNTTYAGTVWNDPNTWASDADYQAYANSKTKQLQSANPTQPYTSVTGGAAGGSLAGLASGTGGGGGGINAGGPGGSFVSNPNGGSPLTQSGFEAEDLAKQQAAAEAALTAEKASLSGGLFAQRLSAIQGLQGSSPTVTPQSVGGPQADAARAAAFARAKELAGNNALAGLRAIQGYSDQRGLTGSVGPGLESGMVGNMFGGAYGGVNDFIREQQIQDLNRAAQVQDETYQGAITQRGQDLQRQQQIIQSLLSAGPLY